jgi:hypothetical protein
VAQRDDGILKELQNISFLLGDLNAIRHGEYEPPKGADSSSQRVRATPDDIYECLSGITNHLERLSVMVYALGQHFVGPDWHRKVGQGS